LPKVGRTVARAWCLVGDPSGVQGGRVAGGQAGERSPLKLKALSIFIQKGGNTPSTYKTRSSAIAGRPCDAKACQLPRIAEMDVEMTT